MFSGIVVPQRLYVEKANGLDKQLMSNAAYREFIRSAVIDCTDTIIIDDVGHEVYLAFRKIQPIRHWWMSGGRRFAGESIEQSAVRHFLKDTGIDLNHNRLRRLLDREYIWSDSEQDPNQGCHILAHTFAVELEAAEIVWACDHLNLDEFDPEKGLQSFGPDRIGICHPAIQDIYRDLFGR